MMKREHADKMLSMGLITPETHARLHQYADGGMVAQEPEYPADPRIPTPDRFNANAGQQALDVGKKALDFAKEAGSHIFNRQKDLLVGPWAVSKQDVNPTNPDAIVPSQIQPADIIAPGVMGAAKAIPGIARTAIEEAPAIGRAAVDFGKSIVERGLGNDVGAIGPGVGELIAKRQAEKMALKNPQPLPMDQASRMARAKQMGFDPETTWYHGTKANIEEFNPQELGSSTRAQSAKKGFFFTTDPSTASDYSSLAPNQTKREYNRVYDQSQKTLFNHDMEIQNYLSSMYKEGQEQKANSLDLIKRLIIGHAERSEIPKLNPSDESAKIRAFSTERQLEEGKRWALQNGVTKEELSDFEKKLEPWAENVKEMSRKRTALNMEHAAQEKAAINSPEIKKLDAEINDTDQKIRSLMKDRSTARSKGLNTEELDKEQDDIQKKYNEMIEARHLKMSKIMDSYNSSGASVYPTHLKMQNPYIHDFEGKSYRDETYADILDKAKALGHDSVILKNTYDAVTPENKKLIDVGVVFEPHQIRSKSAEFDPAKAASGKLTYAMGGVVGSQLTEQKAQAGRDKMFTKDQADLMLQKGLITPQTHQKICGPEFLAGGGVVPGMDGPQASALPPVQSAEEQINAMTGPSTTESPYKDAYQNMITKLSMQMPGADFDTIQQRALNDLSRFQEQEDARRAASMQAADQQIAMQAQRKADIGSKMANLGLGAPPAPVMAPSGPAPAGTPADQGGAPGAPGAPAYGQEQLDYFGQMDKNYRDALAKQTGAMQGLYGAQEKTYTGLQDDLKKAHEAYEKTRASVESSYENLSKELTNAKIDPNRVYENSSTGARIGSVLGILVSGLGAGMSGKENLAISQLNKIIDRDIDAQKTDISNKRNLLNQYREKLGDTRLAEEASRLHLMTMADFQMKQAYAKAQSPMAQAQMGMALNEWNQKMMLMKNELAKNIQEAQYRGVGGMGGRPIGSASFNAATNPKEVELTVPVYDRNREYPARSEAEAKELRKSEEGFGETMSMLNELKQLTSLGSSISPQQRARAEVITQNLPFKLNEINGYNRFTDMDEKMLSKTFSEPGVMQSIFTPNTKTNQLIEDLKKKMELKRGIGLQGYKPILSLKPRGE